MRTPNKFLPGSRYTNMAWWVERGGPFLLWPAAWVEWGIEPVLGVRINRWTAGLGKARLQLDWGVSSRRDPRALIDFRNSGLDGFLTWARKTFGQTWGRTDLDRLFKERPEWKQLVALGDAHAHYVRLLLARELAAAPAARLGPERDHAEGLSALEAALAMDALDPGQSSLLADPSRTAGQDADEGLRRGDRILPRARRQ